MKTELLAPAGDMARLKTAIIYGADAVYFGGKQFSLRSRASNFTLEDIREAVEFAHGYGRRVYVTVNIIPHNDDFNGLEEYLKKLEEFGVDAIICASQAILTLCKRVAPEMEVHISTQQTTINTRALSYWKDKNADRVVLGREVNLKQLEEIMGKTDVPIEVFIHGGMCANYSGRCTISNLLTNRDANRGGCAHSCRWDYHLWHDEELLDRDDYLLSLGSRDMCAAEYLEDILKLDVASLKIEGRMKTAFYIASIVRGYRYLIDCYQKQGYISDRQKEKGWEMLMLGTNREVFAGFYPGFDISKGQLYNFPTTASQNFVANVVSYDRDSSEAVIEVRNHFEKGDTLAVMNPYQEDVTFIVDKMTDTDGEEVAVANRPLQLLRIKVPVEVNEYTFVHLVKEQL
ncbi:MAG: U32 family peptidase [Erysipelotrichaceae bacterium]|nr:U32 family peptidase [Erysipelotrichaceae bacterium]